MKHKMMKWFQLKSLCKPAITGESNKLIGLVTEAEVRWEQDIMEQG